MADTKSAKVKAVVNLNDSWEGNHGLFHVWKVEFEGGFIGKFNVKDGYQPKFVVGETHFYSIKKQATEQYLAEIKWEKDPQGGGSQGGYSGGRKGGGYGGRPHDPNLEMVKNAAVQASHVLVAQMQGTGAMAEEKEVKEMVSHFYFAQKELYDASTPAPAAAPKQETPPPPQEQPGPGADMKPVGEDDDDLPF